MGDNIFSDADEDELLYQAIALSLEQAGASSNAEENLTRQTTEEEASKSPQQLQSSTPVAREKERTSGGAENRPDPPARSNTTQSYDSVLAGAEDSLSTSLRVLASQGVDSSLRSSPDLGIAGEGDIDPQSGTLGVKRNNYQLNSRESLMSSPECERVHPRGLQNLTLDGGVVNIHGNQTIVDQEDGRQLPFTRLSSLHDMNIDLAAAKGRVGKAWIPNPDALELIVGMGISENAAKRGLYNTGNDNAELAVAWVFDNISNPELHEPFTLPTPEASGGGGTVALGLSAVYHSFSNESLTYKMVFVANTSLKMGVGKLCAQVGHAVLALYHCVAEAVEAKQKTALREWETRGATKVVLKGNDTQHLLDLKQTALEMQIPNILVHDAGRTQIDPGSLTVLGLFGVSKDIDFITGKLKLL